MPLMELRGNTYQPEELAEHDTLLFDPRKSEGYVIAQKLLTSAIRHGFFDPSTVKRALDFGAGFGEPTLALEEILPSTAIIEAAEIIPGRASELIRAGIVPEERVYKDGLRRLGQVHLQPDQKYDLITAFMFGPCEVVDFQGFYNTCMGALSEHGQLMVYSDPQTFGQVLNFCEEKAVNYKYNPWGLMCPLGNMNTVHIRGNRNK